MCQLINKKYKSFRYNSSHPEKNYNKHGRFSKHEGPVE
jgi:hypothetical protein